MVVMFINTDITIIDEKSMALQAVKSELDLYLSSSTYCMTFEKFIHLPEPVYILAEREHTYLNHRPIMSM